MLLIRHGRGHGPMDVR